MEYYLEVWRKYATFTGRARRAEYWWFALFNVLALVVLEVIFGVFGAVLGSKNPIALIFALPLFAYILAIIVPSIAVGVRRLHDVNQSGWLILLNLIPGIGPLILLVLSLLPGTPGENKFGPDPKLMLAPSV
ncbi:MAG TPA: DUF805 domain-containing protein [Candidatus Aquilonibacter sp.]|nr:DUF805 domain-containing protein [Candidatus Aquilonibacter sp.]